MKPLANRAIFPGTFDPIHVGHVDILLNASRLFEKVIWLIAENPAKSNHMFSVQRRMDMMWKVLKAYDLMLRVDIVETDKFIVDYAYKNDIEFIIRSFRVTTDFDYEMQLAMINRKLSHEEVKTIFFAPKQEHLHVNSTVVRELIRAGKPLNSFVPDILLHCDGKLETT